VKNWLSEHVAEVIYAFLLAIGNLAGLARLKSTHGKRRDKVESDLEKHTESGERVLAAPRRRRETHMCHAALP